MDRRAFLKRGTHFVLAASISQVPLLTGCSPAPQNPPDPSSSLDSLGVSAHQWQTLAAVHDHLLPSGVDSPGARDINATGYLRFMLTDPEMDPEDRILITVGVAELEKLSLDVRDASFIILSSEQREVVLRRFEKTKFGSYWIPVILNYLLEALLGDPVYGGNPNGIGWQWLEHTPGFPTPPANKRYFLL